jgi:hypothetical protein
MSLSYDDDDDDAIFTQTACVKAVSELLNAPQLGICPRYRTPYVLHCLSHASPRLGSE